MPSNLLSRLNVNPANQPPPSTSEGLIQALKQITDTLAPNTLLMRGSRLSAIRPEDWRNKYPYAFVILEVVKSGEEQESKQEPPLAKGALSKVKNALNNIKKNKKNKRSNKESKQQTFTYIRHPKNLYFPLPISPMALQINTVFASSLSIASRGVLEEHNGINVKQISFSGTTGIFLKRKTFSPEIKPAFGNDAFNTIFAGTIEAFNAASRQFSIIFPNQNNPQNKKFEDPDQDELYNSGYYQYHMLKSFLELYAALKKTPDGKKYRLGLEVGKDRTIYLITPQSFVTQRSASSPMEYTYSFSGLAWGTVDNANLLSAKLDYLQFTGPSQSETLRALNKIRAVRSLVLKGIDIVRQVFVDVETNIIGPLNSLKMILSDLNTGGVITALDVSASKNLALALSTAALSAGASFLKLYVGEADFNSFFSDSLFFAKANQDPGSTEFSLVEDLSNEELVTLLENIPIDALPISPELQITINEIIEQAQSIDNNTVYSLIDNLMQLANGLDAIAAEQGVDSAAWNLAQEIYNSLDSLYYIISSGLLSSKQRDSDGNVIDPVVTFYQNEISSSGGSFISPRGKFAIPYPAGVTLEWLAQRYLGDHTRWHEIVAVNKLQPPYIDEEGFTRKFITNGSGNQFVIDSAENLYAGQFIWLFSDTQKINKRKIKSIQKVTDTQYIITVSGEADLNLYLTAENAKMKAFLPNTVNSQKLIYIPTNESPIIDNIKPTHIGYIDESPDLLAISKIDLLVDDKGDLVITKDGFQNLAFGKTNLIQAAKLKLKTSLGKLIGHPDYGAGVEPGESIADLTLEQLIDNIESSFKSDPRFTEVSKIEIDSKDTGAIKMNISVTALDNLAVVPIEFEIRQ